MRDLTLRVVDIKASLGLLLLMCFCAPLNVCQANDARFNICWATYVAVTVPQLLNSVSCDVKRWNMPFTISWWTKIELGSIPFNELRNNNYNYNVSTSRDNVQHWSERCWTMYHSLYKPIYGDFYCSFLLLLLQLLNRVPCPVHLCDETKRVVMLFFAKCLTCIHRVTSIQRNSSCKVFSTLL